MKNTEVKVNIAGSESSLTILIGVNKSKMQVIQSIKSKAKAEIQLAWMTGDQKKAEAKINKIADDYRALVEPELKKALPNIPLAWTEANSLMKFEVSNNPDEAVTKTFEIKY